MPIASTDTETKIYLIQTQLGKLGIEMPTLPTFTPLPPTTVTEADIIEALRNSKAKDPNQDPEVQRLFLARQISTSALGFVEQDNTKQAEYAELVKHRETLKKKVTAAFEKAAATIAEHAPRVADRTDLGTVSIQQDDRRVVTAAVTIADALDTADIAHRAWWLLEAMGRPQVTASGPEYLGWCDPSVDEAAKIQANGDPTIWNTARAGVTLALPTDRRALEQRWRKLDAARREHRAAQDRDRPRQKINSIVNAANL